MKLIDILKELLKEDSNDRFFLLKPSDIFEVLTNEFLKTTPSIQKIISRGQLSQVDLYNAIEGLSGMTFSSSTDIDDVLDANASKSEIIAAKKDIESFVSSFKKEYPALSNVFKAVYTAYDQGTEDLMNGLSPQDIDTYLKYYTSDLVNKGTNIRSSKDYNNFIGVLKDLKKK
jgi:hypothetical protein